MSFTFAFHSQTCCANKCLPKFFLCYPLQSIGFEWTYILVGGCLLFSSIVIIFVTPEPRKHRQADPTVENAATTSPNGIKSADENPSSGTTAATEAPSIHGIFRLLKIPAIQYAILSMFATAASIGFITGTLEAHLKQVNIMQTFHQPHSLPNMPPSPRHCHLVPIINSIFLLYIIKCTTCLQK